MNQTQETPQLETTQETPQPAKRTLEKTLDRLGAVILLLLGGAILLIWPFLLMASFMMCDGFNENTPQMLRNAFGFLMLGIFCYPGVYIGFLVISIFMIVRKARRSAFYLLASFYASLPILYIVAIFTIFFLCNWLSGFNAKTNNGNTPLHIAVMGNEDVKVAKLLAEGADVNATNNNGATPLHYATMPDFVTNIDIVKSLVDQGADVNAKDSEGYTPLHWAVRKHENVEVVRFLVDQGADVNAKDYYDATPLFSAAWCNTHPSVEVAKFLVDRGADINARNRDGHTPLHWAAGMNESVEVAKFLVDRGVDVNAKSDDGTTPLHWAVRNSVEVIQYLVTQGADVNAKDDTGYTPLDEARLYNRTEVADFLQIQGGKSGKE